MTTNEPEASLHQRLLRPVSAQHLTASQPSANNCGANLNAITATTMVATSLRKSSQRLHLDGHKCQSDHSLECRTEYWSAANSVPLTVTTTKPITPWGMLARLRICDTERPGSTEFVRFTLFVSNHLYHPLNLLRNLAAIPCGIRQSL